ncbi:MAG: hypothetical protein JXC32_10145 [Anaerolineae bacterium]|nr:hypothetical protein [Anaerolineae bacterium]
MESHQRNRGTIAMEWPTAIAARIRIDVSPAQARAWFLALGDHPERYRFGSHDGFTFTRGSFGTVGACFETQERFGFIRLTLRFELTRVTSQQFSFLLRHPISSIYGRFAIEPASEHSTQLELAVGSPYLGKRLLLHLPIVHGAIRYQIQQEVDHIRQSMEALYQEETWAS